MAFECKRCGYETARISNIKDHLNRKKPCKDIKNCGISAKVLLKSFEKDTSLYQYECDICHKKYKSMSGVYAHRPKCAANTIIEDMNEMKTALKEYEQRFETLEKNMSQLVVSGASTSASADASSGASTSSFVNSQQNINAQQNIAQQNNIIINHLGGENLSYITPEFIEQCIKKRLDGLIDYIDKKHFHPEHPENHNLRIENGALRMLEEPFFANDRNTRSKEPAGANFWTAVKSNDTALEEKILPRVETAFKAFLNSRDASSLGEDYLCKFIQEIVLPLDWSMDMHELEEELDTDDEETLSAVKTKIFGKILHSIERRYQALVKTRI